jgi:hypothetical protein
MKVSEVALYCSWTFVLSVLKASNIVAVRLFIVSEFSQQSRTRKEMATDSLEAHEIDSANSLPLVEKNVLEGHTAAVSSVKFNRMFVTFTVVNKFRSGTVCGVSKL